MDTVLSLKLRATEGPVHRSTERNGAVPASPLATCTGDLPLAKSAPSHKRGKVERIDEFEIAVNGGSAAERLALGRGARVTITMS